MDRGVLSQRSRGDLAEPRVLEPAGKPPEPPGAGRPPKFETCPTRGANLNGYPSSLARLFWLDASQGLFGCQLEFFDSTLNEIPDLGLQRRLEDSPHLEGERD